MIDRVISVTLSAPDGLGAKSDDSPHVSMVSRNHVNDEPSHGLWTPPYACSSGVRQSMHCDTVIFIEHLSLVARLEEGNDVILCAV